MSAERGGSLVDILDVALAAIDALRECRLDEGIDVAVEHPEWS